MIFGDLGTSNERGRRPQHRGHDKQQREEHEEREMTLEGDKEVTKTS